MVRYIYDNEETFRNAPTTNKDTLSKEKDVIVFTVHVIQGKANRLVDNVVSTA